MNMNLVSVVIPPSIYHCCSTQKTLWEGKFMTVNMKVVVVNMLGNTWISISFSITSPCKSL